MQSKGWKHASFLLLPMLISDLRLFSNAALLLQHQAIDKTLAQLSAAALPRLSYSAAPILRAISVGYRFGPHRSDLAGLSSLTLLGA